MGGIITAAMIKRAIMMKIRPNIVRKKYPMTLKKVRPFSIFTPQ